MRSEREPGFYWWRRAADEPWQVVRVRDDEQLLFTGSDWPSRLHGIFGPRVNPPVTTNAGVIDAAVAEDRRALGEWLRAGRGTLFMYFRDREARAQFAELIDYGVHLRSPKAGPND